MRDGKITHVSADELRAEAAAEEAKLSKKSLVENIKLAGVLSY